MRITIASASPMIRARARCSGGRRLTRMEMKMMLSTPRTISSAVRLKSAIHASGDASQSMRAPSRAPTVLRSTTVGGT